MDVYVDRLWSAKKELKRERVWKKGHSLLFRMDGASRRKEGGHLEGKEPANNQGVFNGRNEIAILFPNYT